jgi:hypothetical protein
MSRFSRTANRPMIHRTFLGPTPPRKKPPAGIKLIPSPGTDAQGELQYPDAVNFGTSYPIKSAARAKDFPPTFRLSWAE